MINYIQRLSINRFALSIYKNKMEADKHDFKNNHSDVIDTKQKHKQSQKQKQNQLLKSQQKSQIFDSILQYLQQKQIPYKLMEHQSTQTSAQSAKIRNTPLQWGSKTMLVRGKPKAKQANDKKQQNPKDDIWMLLYRANHKLSWNKIRKIQELGKKSKMLSEQQLWNIFKLKPGSVPPFANLLNIQAIVDSRFELQKNMAFNAGLRDKSIVMDTCNFGLQYFKCVSITQDQKIEQNANQHKQKIQNEDKKQ